MLDRIRGLGVRYKDKSGRHHEGCCVKCAHMDLLLGQVEVFADP